MPNMTRCASHGGNIPAVVAAAHTRGMMAADRFMAKLHEIAFDDSQPPAVQLEAIKQGLVHAGFTGKQVVELTVSKEKTYEDVLEGVLVDVAEDTDEDPNVIDADVVEDAEAYERDRDRRVAEVAEREGVAPKRKRPLVSNEQRAVQERDLFEQAPPEPETRASQLTREQYMLARERGDNFSSRGLGRRADAAASGRRSTRNSEADFR